MKFVKDQFLSFIILPRKSKRLLQVSNLFSIVFFASAMIGYSASTVAADSVIYFGTGGKSGVYYPAGKVICQHVSRIKNGIKCRARSTGGSVDNLKRLRNGEFQLIVARSDWGKHASKGSSLFSSIGPYSDLRSMFSLHPEPLNILVRKDSDIQTLTDLKGKRINIGRKGSSIHGQFSHLMRKLGWRNSDFAELGSIKVREQGKSLCSRKFDAVVYSVGYPSSTIKALAKSCRVRLVELDHPKIDGMAKANSDLRKITIPSNTYRGIPRAVKTYGYGATILTSINVSDEVVYQVVKSTFSNLAHIRRAGPYWNTLKVSEMIKDSLSAELHPGAARYYREQGWIK